MSKIGAKSHGLKIQNLTGWKSKILRVENPKSHGLKIDWPRIVDKQIEDYLRLFGAICIDGPKYSGKTWAGRRHARSEILLQSRGNGEDIISLAKISPELVLEGEKPKLIDEWQEATNLWDFIRCDVDKT